MQISVLGAAGEVTGSCYLLTTMRAQVLIDCGMFQGRDAEHFNVIPPNLRPESIDAIVLTHAHLDHIGRLPLLVRAGYRGPIYATAATIDLAGLLLEDAAHIQESDADRENRHRQRAGLPPIAPLFDRGQVQAVLRLMRRLPYDEPTTVAPSVTVRAVEAGHILGSVSLIVHAVDKLGVGQIVFSGDIGRPNAPILNDPAVIGQADLVVMESTYGDRRHRSQAETLDELVGLVQQAVEQRSKVLIPAFAVGRTQELLYQLAALVREARLPPLPIYLDSPLAMRATELYMRYPGLADAESRAVTSGRRLWRGLEQLHICGSPAESQRLNATEGPCIIIAGSGMCNGGRILHHLRHNLWRPETIVVIVGYQAAGTLGRELVERPEHVRIFGEEIAVRAQVHTLGGFSAHADQSELLAWLAPMAAGHPQVVLTHGEDLARQALADAIAVRFGITPLLPELGSTVTVDRRTAEVGV